MEDTNFLQKPLSDLLHKSICNTHYGGLGVDGLAKEAGVTSGAFYGHFKSKEEAFHAATLQGMIDYRDNVAKMQAAYGTNWLKHFFDYYLGAGHIDDIDSGCAVPGLSPDVMRSKPETKVEYEKYLQEIAEAIREGLPDKDINKARALIVLLSGAVTMARAVADKKIAAKIAASSRQAAEMLLLG